MTDLVKVASILALAAVAPEPPERRVVARIVVGGKLVDVYEVEPPPPDPSEPLIVGEYLSGYVDNGLEESPWLWEPPKEPVAR